MELCGPTQKKRREGISRSSEKKNGEGVGRKSVKGSLLVQLIPSPEDQKSELEGEAEDASTWTHLSYA